MAEREKFTEEELLQIFQGVAPAPSAPSSPPAQPAAPASPEASPPPAPPEQIPSSPAPPPLSPLPAAPSPPSPVQGAVEGAAPPAAPAAPEPPAPPAINPADEATVEDLGRQFEISRARMEQVLMPFIGEKPLKRLLAWSLERVQKEHPIVKNVHWSSTGDLLDNGAIEVDRLKKELKNFSGQDVVALVKAALSELLTVRLNAVEQGLGPALRQAVEKEVAGLVSSLR